MCEMQDCEVKASDFYRIGNLEGLPKCVVHFLDVCKLMLLPYLVPGFCDMFMDQI